MKVNFDNLFFNHANYFSLLEVLPFLAKVFDDENERNEFMEHVRSELRSSVNMLKLKLSKR